MTSGAATITTMHAGEAEHPDSVARKAFGFWIYLMSDLVLFASLFATFAVMSHSYAGGPTGKDLFDKYGIREVDKKAPWGWGPYELKELQVGQRIVLAKNPASADVKPEKGDTFTMGLVLQHPGSLENFTASFDYYKIEITDAIAPLNVNGDYSPDALAAQVGGIGIPPGGNLSDDVAQFEATHGTAPKYADKDVINPGSVILSGMMMFDFMGWAEAARLIEDALERTIQQKKVTYDFERLMEGATKVKTSEFATHLIGNMDAVKMQAAD